jgi:hypothetical protein
VRVNPSLSKSDLARIIGGTAAAVGDLGDEHLGAVSDADTEARRFRVPKVGARVAFQRANAEVGESDGRHELGTFWVPKSIALKCITMETKKQEIPIKYGEVGCVRNACEAMFRRVF